MYYESWSRAWNIIEETNSYWQWKEGNKSGNEVTPTLDQSLVILYLLLILPG